MMGESKGSVTWRKRCHAVAPSMEQASYSEGEMVCSPASSEMATNGTPRHTLAAMVDSRAFQGSPRKSICSLISPACRKLQDSTENCASYSHQKAIAESAVGTIQGSSTTARKNDWNGKRRLRSSASHKPSPNFRALATIV